jgi:membrane protein YqaA with SNARE-associated domain
MPIHALTPIRPLATFVSPSTRNLTRWLLHLGGIGLIPLGLLDSSVVPIPGSMDVATILLSAREKHLWLYYALMATAGSVLGAFLTFRLARKGGKEALAKKFSKQRVDKVLKTFERWGFAAIVVPALLPPPFPLVPFVIAAGAMQYSLPKFLTAIGIGRFVRYTLLAFLGAIYGRHILSLFSRHASVAIFIGIAIVVGALVAVLLTRKRR